MKQMIIASTSTIHGSSYLDYLLDNLKLFFKDADTIIFIPYARPGGISHEDYTKKAQEAFSKIGKTVKGLHEFDNPKNSISIHSNPLPSPLHMGFCYIQKCVRPIYLLK